MPERGFVIMFGIGFTEIMIVALIALVVVGPDKLPEIANYMGKLLGTFRKANVEIKQTLRDIKPPDVMDIIETRLKEEAGLQEVKLPEADAVVSLEDKKEDDKKQEADKTADSTSGTSKVIDSETDKSK